MQKEHATPHIVSEPLAKYCGLGELPQCRASAVLRPDRGDTVLLMVAWWSGTCSVLVTVSECSMRCCYFRLCWFGAVFRSPHDRVDDSGSELCKHNVRFWRRPCAEMIRKVTTILCFEC